MWAGVLDIAVLDTVWGMCAYAPGVLVSFLSGASWGPYSRDCADLSLLCVCV